MKKKVGYPPLPKGKRGVKRKLFGGNKKTDKNVVLLVRKLVSKLEQKVKDCLVSWVQASELVVKYVSSKSSKTWHQRKWSWMKQHQK